MVYPDMAQRCHFVAPRRRLEQRFCESELNNLLYFQCDPDIQPAWPPPLLRLTATSPGLQLIAGVESYQQWARALDAE
jgi:hypothetical protein